MDIEGKTLGVIGLGKLGAACAGVAKAFGMKVIAWSQNLTPEKCKEAGVDYATKEDLFRNADIVTIHVQLGDRSRGLVGAKELALMKPTAYLVNTVARADRRREGADRCARRTAASPAPASTCSMSSRCRSIIRSASSTTWCSRRISAMSASRTTRLFPRHRREHPRFHRRQAGAGDQIARTMLRIPSAVGLPLPVGCADG